MLAAVGAAVLPETLATTVLAAWVAIEVRGIALTVIAPAALIAAGAVALKPALPTLAIGIAVGICPTGTVPLLISEPAMLFPVSVCVPVKLTSVSDPEGISTVPVIAPAAGCTVNVPLVALPIVNEPSVPEAPRVGVAVPAGLALAA